MAKTVIQVDEATREKLHDLGAKGESYDKIIRKLLRKYEKEIEK